MRWRVPVSPAAVSSRSAAGSTEPPSEPTGESVGSEGGSEEEALEWLEAQTAHIWRMWGQRFPAGKDWT